MVKMIELCFVLPGKKNYSDDCNGDGESSNKLIPHTPVPSFTQLSPQPCKRPTNHDHAQSQDTTLTSSQSAVHPNSTETPSVTSELNQTQYPVQCENKISFSLFFFLSFVCPFIIMFTKAHSDHFIQ